MDFRSVGLFGLRHALQHQDKRTANCGDVDRLEGCVEDKDRGLHYRGTARTHRGSGHRSVRLADVDSRPGTQPVLEAVVHHSHPFCSCRLDICPCCLDTSEYAIALGSGFPALRLTLLPKTYVV